MEIYFKVKSVEWYHVNGRGDVAVIPSPWDVPMRDDLSFWIDKIVEIDEAHYRILGTEYFATIRGPSEGYLIGLLVTRDLRSKE